MTKIAKQSYADVKKTSPIIEEVRYYAQELIRLIKRGQVVVDNKVSLTQPLPEYEILLSIPGIAETIATSTIGELGDIHRFQSANQVNAFIGIDLRHYESANFIDQEHITNEEIPMLERYYSNVSTTLIQRVIQILVILQISKRNEKSNRK